MCRERLLRDHLVLPARLGEHLVRSSRSRAGSTSSDHLSEGVHLVLRDDLVPPAVDVLHVVVQGLALVECRIYVKGRPRAKVLSANPEVPRLVERGRGRRARGDERVVPERRSRRYRIRHPARSSPRSPPRWPSLPLWAESPAVLDDSVQIDASKLGRGNEGASRSLCRKPVAGKARGERGGGQ